VLKIEKSKNLVYNIYIRLREKRTITTDVHVYWDSSSSFINSPPILFHENLHDCSFSSSLPLLLREGKPYKPVWVANTPTGARSPRR
jgi:hypothetical protein